ncbi:hypothetical protein [Capnocytophaga bilenii]
MFLSFGASPSSHTRHTDFPSSHTRLRQLADFPSLNLRSTFANPSLILRSTFGASRTGF